MQWVLQPIGRALNRLGVTPQIMTIFGLAVSVTGAVMIGAGMIVGGALVALVGSILDGLDGSVARAAGTESAPAAA